MKPYILPLGSIVIVIFSFQDPEYKPDTGTIMEPVGIRSTIVQPYSKYDAPPHRGSSLNPSKKHCKRDPQFEDPIS